MTVPRFNSWLARGFDLAFDRIKSVGLAGIHMRIPEGLTDRLDPKRPVLLYGNHASNWDGFLFHDVQRRLRPGVPTYSLMLERELVRLPLFRALGGLGIDPGSPRSTARALQAARALRGRENDFFFSVFPQGSTFPAMRRPLDFQEGVRAFARALSPVTLLPVGLSFDLCGSLRPHAFVTVGEPHRVENVERDLPSLALLESRVTVLLDDVHDWLSREGEGATGEMKQQRKGGGKGGPDVSAGAEKGAS